MHLPDSDPVGGCHLFRRPCKHEKLRNPRSLILSGLSYDHIHMKY
jgi:hypothetical protein